MRSNLMLRSALAMPAILTYGVALHRFHANTLTGIVGDLYTGLDLASREMVGFLPAARRNVAAERAAVGQNVVWPVVPKANVSDIMPSMAIPEPTDQTIGNGGMTITKAKAAEFGWVGEEQRALNTSVGVVPLQAQMFAEGIRELANLMEADLAVEAALNASRATGTPGSTPFDPTTGRLRDSAQLRKILDDNGAPARRALIINTTTGANLRENPAYSKVNEAGTTMTLRQGSLGDLHGFVLSESGALREHISGTGASLTTTAGALAEGTTVIPLASAGTGNVKRGDVISIAGDPNKYVVAVGDTDVSNGGSITIAAPGLMQAKGAVAAAITVADDFEINVGFAEGFLQLAARAPALPQEGDAALDRMIIVDPRSGIPFEVSVYGGYRKVRYEVAIAWGVGHGNPEHAALMMG